MLSGTVLYGISIYAEHDMSARDRVQDAERVAADRIVVQGQSRMTVESAAWAKGSGTFTLTLTNDGAVTLRLSDVDVVVDGEPRTGDITSLLVEGTSSTVWPPATQLVIEMDLSAYYQGNSEPTNAVVVSDEGIRAYWRA